jgi:hypothetical protein
MTRLANIFTRLTTWLVIGLLIEWSLGSVFAVSPSSAPTPVLAAEHRLNSSAHCWSC